MTELVIARHCVRRGPDRLSSLQCALLEATVPIRIAVAPTGSGKTYAFVRVMLDRKARILFVVPTRRLAQNLLDGLRRVLAAEGWPEGLIRAKTGLWTSDGSLALRGMGKDPIVERLMQVLGGVPSNDRGEFFVATAESLSHLLVMRRLTTGQSDIGLLDVLTRFDHLVFDEFHTLEPAGFAFAAVLARALTAIPDTHARLTFLSATPVDLRPALVRTGVPTDAIAALEEEISSEGHALHGDVTLVLTEAPSLADILLAHRERVLAEIGSGRKVVLVYDQLWEGVFGEMERLATVLAEIGVPASRVLRINSVDDSGDRAGESPQGFAVGRDRDPAGFDLIVATASIEMGVNLDCAFLVMEPGFSPLSFLQRYGRAARGDLPGLVVVRTNVPRPSPWLADLTGWAQACQGTRQTIQALTGVLGARLARLVREGLDQDPGALPETTPTFGAMPDRAALIAGLYWEKLIRHPSVNSHRRRQLQVGAPVTHRLVIALLRRVEQELLDIAPRSSERFVEAMLQAALRLRSIGETIRVREERGEGRTLRVPLVKLARYTDVLLRYPLRYDGDEMEIVIDGALENRRGERQRFVERITAVFPHEEATRAIEHGADAIRAWCTALRQPKSSCGEQALYDAPEAIDAAERLVRLTGLIPSNLEPADGSAAAFASV
jgi:hypothetical protein